MALPYLDWPFFETPHRELAEGVASWIAKQALRHDEDDIDGQCRAWVRTLGAAGWLRACVAGTRWGGLADALDSRSLCLLRETLACHHGLADFAFAMQGLGSGAISLAGTEAQLARYLPRVAKGEAIAAFALSEPEAGSDVAALACRGRIENDVIVIDGEKTWISNGGIADFYVVFLRTEDLPGTRGLSACIVDADTPGLEIAERIEVIAPHPLARLMFKNCRVPLTQLLGAPGEGFKLAMRTLDIFRSSVAAAANGFARAAFEAALARCQERRMFGQRLGDFQLTQTKLAQMALRLDAAALLTYRAAWERDRGQKVTREAAMAKLYATEEAQRTIDDAVQIFGGLGVTRGQTPERLYREIRALRIYEGASEVQQLIIGREALRTSFKKLVSRD